MCIMYVDNRNRLAKRVEVKVWKYDDELQKKIFKELPFFRAPNSKIEEAWHIPSILPSEFV